MQQQGYGMQQQGYGMQQQGYGMQQQQMAAPPGKLLYIIDILGMMYVLWIFNTAFIQHMVVGFTNTYAINAYQH